MGPSRLEKERRTKEPPATCTSQRRTVEDEIKKEGTSRREVKAWLLIVSVALFVEDLGTGYRSDRKSCYYYYYSTLH